MKRKLLKRLGIGLGTLLGLFVLLCIVLLLIYPAILRHVHRIEAPGIDSMEIVEIGGIPQALYFRGRDVENPVILFIHGGPGSPVMPRLHDFQFAWEDYFTVVHWDQRNTGKTYFLSDPEVVLETLSFERMLVDAYEVTQHIRSQLGKDRIIIMGYSWGSVVGTVLVQSYPQYFSAYIGLGQLINLRDADRAGFEALLQAVQDGGNSIHIAAVEALAPYPPDEPFEDWFSQFSEFRSWQRRYGFVSSGGFGETFLLLTSPYYSLREKMWRSTTRYHMPILNYIFDDFDARNLDTTFEVPMFFITGEHDYITPPAPTRDFYEQISAPIKAFFLIPDAGHAVMHYNHPEFNRVLLEEIRPLIPER